MSTGSNINKLSSEYEKLYKSINLLTINSHETILLLNDFFIVSILLKRKGQSILKKDIVSIFKKFQDYVGSYELLSKLNTVQANDIFKNVFEFVNGYSDASDFEKMFGIVLEKHINRKSTGSYYTPDDTTKFICWNTIFVTILNKMPSLLADKIRMTLCISNNVEFIDKKMSFENKIKLIGDSLCKDDIEKIIRVIKKMRIIDPTCGSGAFIISAYECLSFLNDNLLHGNLNKNYYYNNLFGVDIQEEAISLVKTRLLIKTIIDCNFSKNFFKKINSNFISNDALRGSDKLLKGNDFCLDWNELKDFDCIVGNPPYVEVKNKNEYKNFESVNCGNLYAYTIERSCNISSNNSMISFIVPLSFVSTPRMNDIKQYLEKKSKVIYYCTFADRPGCLFSGVHQRLVIFFAIMGKDKCRKFTSSYNFWYKDERFNLFNSLNFYENTNKLMPKIGTQIENNIYHKTRNCDMSIDELKIKNGVYNLYVSTRIGFWAKAFLNMPPTNEIMILNFKTELDKKIVYCFINSSLFYYQWVILSDCWHITNTNLKEIKFNYKSLTAKQKELLSHLCAMLSSDLEKHKVRINSKQTEFEYKHKYSKNIIDKIDDVFCLCAGLNEEETNFIKNYTLKYRMNTIEEGESI